MESNDNTNNTNGVNTHQPEPIAIVGMACRLPGQASNLQDFWELCSRGRSAWSEFPKDRFNAEAYYHPNPDRTGFFNPQGGHFVNQDVSFFDAPFFNITLQEARSLDPQQRFLLECTYEALENGGLTMPWCKGRDVGVFVGGAMSDYEIANLRDLASVPMHQSTGNALSLQANRISYYFDLKGPSIAVDTACSSSLTALHLACQSLRSGECSAAIVGGCRLNLGPDIFVSMSLSRLFSETEKTFPFDQQALSQTVTGYGRGEGAGCVLLKPLQDAIDAGDPIRAVVTHTGINQDGKTRGITMPNKDAQAALIRSVYQQASIDPFDVGFVEAHGTGTAVGDPLEAEALYNVLCKDRGRKEPLFIGSVKSNLGHLESASGIAALIKAALILERGFILPNCNVKEPHEKIPLDKWNMKISTEQNCTLATGQEICRHQQLWLWRRECSHVLEKAPKITTLDPSSELLLNVVRESGTVRVLDDHLPRYVYTLSGHKKDVVKAMCLRLRSYLEKHPDVFDGTVMSNTAYTLTEKRTVFPWKIAFEASSARELIGLLSADLVPLHRTSPPVISFVFTGQGAQWYGMAQKLLRTSVPFLEKMRSIDKILENLGSTISLIDEIQKETSDSSLYEPFLSQPACTAVQIALVDLMRSWGVAPTAVIGHSSGEIAAAYAAGILDTEQCTRIAYLRGLATQELKQDTASSPGSMMVASANASTLQPFVEKVGKDRVVMACFNSENSITLSGDNAAIDEIEKALQGESILTRKIQTGVAYHSHHMKPIAARYRALMSDLPPGSAGACFYSTVRGKCISYSDLTSDYWVENLLSPVRFTTGLTNLIDNLAGTADKKSDVLLIEIGPHSALRSPIQATVRSHPHGTSVAYLPTLRRDEASDKSTQGLAASLFTRAVPLHFEAVNNFENFGRRPRTLRNLPTYPWDHSVRLARGPHPAQR